MQDQDTRPGRLVADILRRYPDAVALADQLRNDPDLKKPKWPDWCYLPLAASYAIISRGSDRLLTPAEAMDVGRLGAAISWRMGKGIYRFDPTLLAELLETPVSGDLPCDVLYRLPEWCVYVETPGASGLSGPLHGFFAYLEWDATDGRSELRLVLDEEAELIPTPIHLGAWPLIEGLRRMQDEAALYGCLVGRPKELLDESELASTADWYSGLISLLLYLCSDQPEIHGAGVYPSHPRPIMTRRGPRLFAADKPVVWDVGVRLGAALRKAREKQEATEERNVPPNAPTGRPVRPHVRRAHWHGYWYGRASEPKTFRLRWLSPILVGVEDADQMPAVIHPVNKGG